MDQQVIEYVVLTAQGRRMTYSRRSGPYTADDCKRDAELAGHIPISIMPLKEAKGR